jgi:hypothetical protein
MKQATEHDAGDNAAEGSGSRPRDGAAANVHQPLDLVTTAQRFTPIT